MKKTIEMIMKNIHDHRLWITSLSKDTECRNYWHDEIIGFHAFLNNVEKRCKEYEEEEQCCEERLSIVQIKLVSLYLDSMSHQKFFSDLINSTKVKNAKR